jgi:amidase
MNATDVQLAFRSASETADAVRTKKISASELTNLMFQRIDRYNPALNAIVWQDRDRAMAHARQADEALARGHLFGALHGVPVTIKESFAYKDSPNTWGIPALKVRSARARPLPSSVWNPQAPSSLARPMSRSCSVTGSFNFSCLHS